jgi:CP family cyanate transporter-like MFS transporter
MDVTNGTTARRRRLRRVGTLALLWWVGANLRITMLALPPVTPLIHRDLDLNQTLIGLLNSLPTLMFALAAVFGSFLIARLGARRALLAGLLAVGVASGLRGAGLSVPVIFAMTFFMGIGIAVMQPSLPAVVREWCPAEMGLATAVYANGLLVGEIIGAAVTIPVVLPLVGGSWPWALAVWAVPAFLTAAAVWAFTAEAPCGAQAGGIHWRLDWRDANGWRYGIALGGAASLYFSTNAFIPDLLADRKELGFVNAALTSLNACQLFSSALMILFPARLIGNRSALIAAALLGIAGVVGLVVQSGPAIVFWSGLIGFAASFILIWTLAVPPLVAEPHDAHRLSALIFTIGYAYAFVSPVLGGFAWDAARVPAAGFIPTVLGLGGSIVAALSLPAGLRPPRSPQT